VSFLPLAVTVAAGDRLVDITEKFAPGNAHER